MDMAMRQDSYVEVEIDLKWGKMRGKAWNSPGGKPLLCICGSSHNSSSFDLLAPLLPKEYYIVAIDIPGHGLSDHLPAGIPYTNSIYTMALIAAIRENGWKSVSLLGHCFGAIICFQFALIYADMVEVVIALDTPCWFTKPLAAKAMNEKFHIKKPSYSNLAHLMVEQFYNRETKGHPQHKPESKDRSIQRMRDQAYEDLPIEAALVLFDRTYKHVGEDQYVVRRDPKVATMCFDYTFLSNEDEFASRLPLCRWKLMIIRAETGKYYNYYAHITPIYEKLMKSRFQFVTVPGTHQNHMITPKNAAAHINRFLSPSNSKL